MKKILLLVILILSVLVIFFLYINYYLDGKLVEKFIEDLQGEKSFDDHPQGQLIKELRELGITEKLTIIKRKVTFQGGKTIVGIKEGEHQFTFQLIPKRNDNYKKVIIKGIDTKIGLLLEKKGEGNVYHYLLQGVEGREFTFTSPFDLKLENFDIVNLVIVGNEIMTFIPLEKVTVSKVLSADSQKIMGEIEGTFSLDSDVYIFGKEERLYVGQKKVDLYLKNKTVIGIVTREKFVPNTIRVLISDSSYNNIFHQQLQLYSDGDLKIFSKLNEGEITVKPNKRVQFKLNSGKIEVVVDNISHIFSERIYLESTGKIYLTSVKRGWNNSLTPGYRGNFEVFTKDGKMFLINELNLEEYLYGVVPSEMPVSFGLEALKIQAIAARTYAIKNIYSSTYKNYTAHVVDSVLSQVYNNTLEFPEIIDAVNMTKGQVITFNDGIIDAKFFSTSCGYTANSYEVWDSGGKFPGKVIPYLISSQQGILVKYDLTTEEGFKEFITNKNIRGYDSQSPFFRWEINMTNQQLTKSIEENLRNRYRAGPKWILTYDNGEFISKEIPPNPLGELKELQVVERGEGGNIMVLDIIAKNGTYRIIKEYNIRSIIRPVCQIDPVKLIRSDGSILSNYSILPSSFVYFQHNFGERGLESVRIFGGGNGHGVGMSQYGVLGMIQQGYTQEEIITHFYPNTKIKRIY
ncbi:SpoIID/LytB domain-containing protein [Anaerobranca gottschalkii]|uniref:SpoIID/LytB domain protein n=1 Tax=Anaerobranca gottschalkii DSM 13577 TaxID=1120990 RepID=A0A1I0BPD1_9FIRM|nr:SpoIID/LytB domain-containing protein [Anaerobranca gottschalkii]SET08734.1 SpoIID/LytB domain protein [Anaerobranca gottschalkii DSM 13577]